MTEKVTWILAKRGKKSRQDHPPVITSNGIQFLQRVFEISYKRANKLWDRMSQSEGTSDEVTVVTNYRQLARYICLRQENNKYWIYPRILEHIEDVEEEITEQPIELRPDLRSVPI